MSTSATGKRLALATGVSVDEDLLSVTLSDGRELTLPVSRFAFLRTATPAERAGGKVIASGTALWWESSRMASASPA